jgi:hypothetical protein
MRRDNLAATVWKLARALLILCALVAAGACAGGDSGSSGSSSPSAPSGGQPTLSGTWSGNASDSSGPGLISWQISQSGTSFSGSAAITDTRTGITGRGSVSGTVSGSSITFSISIPAGGFDSPFGSCSANISGTGQASSSSITGTYSGSNSCSGDVGSGQFTVTKL